MEPREPCIFLQRCVFRMKNIAATASLFFQRYPSFQAHLDRNVCSSYPACHNRLQSRDVACCKSRCSATGWPLLLLLCGHWSNWKSIYSSSLIQLLSASFTGLPVGFPACDMPLKRILRGIYGSSLSRVYYIGNFTFTFKHVSSPQSFNIKSGGWVMLQANQTEMS